MSALLPYTPWLVFLVMTRTTDWRLGLAAGLVAQIVVLAISRSRRIGVLDAGMLAFFAGFLVVALVRPDSGLEDHLTNISMAWLTVLAGTSILVGRPFTLKYSEDGVSPEIARSELFRSINRTIAWAWTAAFAAMAAIGFLSDAVDRRPLGTVASIVIIVAAIRFTKRYPDRAVAAAGVHDHTPAPAS